MDVHDRMFVQGCFRRSSQGRAAGHGSRAIEAAGWLRGDRLEARRVGVRKRDRVDKRDKPRGDVVEGANDRDLTLAFHVAEGGAAFAQDGDGVGHVLAGHPVGEGRFSGGAPLQRGFGG